MARPLKGFDIDLIEKLAAIHCTNSEIAATIGCDSSLLSKPRYSEIIAKGREKGKTSLRRKMFETAQNGNVTMMIWLSKQYLGFSDKVEERVDHTTKGQSLLTDEQLDARIKKLEYKSKQERNSS